MKWDVSEIICGDVSSPPTRGAWIEIAVTMA